MENSNLILHEYIQNICKYPELLDKSVHFNYEIFIYNDGNIKIIKETVNPINREERIENILFQTTSSKEIYPIIIDYYKDILDNLNTNLPAKYLEEELLQIKSVLNSDKRFLNDINMRFNSLIRKNVYYKMENANLKIMNNNYRVDISNLKKIIYELKNDSDLNVIS
jgi:hypothetical protein